MKILFTHSYFLYFDTKQLESSKPYPPLATLVAAAFMREKGFDVAFIDVNFELSPQCINSAIELQKPDVLVIYDDGFNYLTKMCLTNMRDAAYEMIHYANAHQVPVLISSSDSTDHYAAYLEKGASAVLLGEAEDTLLEVITCMQQQHAFHHLLGVAATHEGKTQCNPRRPVRKALDELPFAAWDLLNITSYQKAWERHGYFSINMATTRGCPFKCNWCAKPIYGNRYNSRSPQAVVEELAYMRSLFHFDHVWFSDDIFGLKPGWVNEFGTLLQEKNMVFTYKIQSRADLLLEHETIAALAHSGADEIWIGAESGSQKILDAMDKGTIVEQLFQATNLMKANGLKPCFFLQFGYLDENEADIQATVDMLFALMPFDIGISVSYPLPGTKFYERVKSQLSEKQNWTDSDELLLMYKGNFPPNYYKSLHRFIHKKFRAKKSIAHFVRLLRFTKGKGKQSEMVGLKNYFSFIYFYPASWLNRLMMVVNKH